MNRRYDDLLALTDVPLSFFQKEGVPRWGRFDPDASTGVYARECAIAEIACQSCDTRFHVLFEHRGDGRDGAPLRERIASSQLLYRDPPNVGCCLGGPSMTSETVRVVEYWSKDATSREWTRDPTLDIAFRRLGDPLDDATRDRARKMIDDPETPPQEIASLENFLRHDDDLRKAAGDPRPEPRRANVYVKSNTAGEC